ncbi:MAG: DUF2330 domain-containing protein [Myxococcaceae bacterium]
MRIALACIALFATAAAADPCGMVPPIYPGGQMVPIVRTGAQRTYAFYKDGVETYVIRPGFTGKAEEFGMLIPFPSPPALRKVPDEVFLHMSAAIDPPEVIVDLRPMPPMLEADAPAMAGAVEEKSIANERPLKYDEVKVINQEAVGMYEVATLAAGSAEALNKWMTQHGFMYPKGMDAVVNDYVKLQWVFVAEKTKVGSKENADPKPGMKTVNPSLPSNAQFDGFVQAMGFRFKTDKPSLPMRLSPFNEGDNRQVIYFLTDQPIKFDDVSTALIKRQVPGWRLLKNVTHKLPLRILGGTPANVTKEILAQVQPMRDPKPYNGHAKDLLASDLLALKTGQLSLDFEEKEKELLRIGEAFAIRGPEIDALHEAHGEIERDKAAQLALGSLEGYWLTVFDGAFPIDVLKAHDLTFSKHVMPVKENLRTKYDAKQGEVAATIPGYGYGWWGGDPNEGIRWEAP